MEKDKSEQPIEALDQNELESGKGEDGGEGEKKLDVPFGLLGASFLCNVLQYAVFLGLTMIVLIIIRVFAAR